jgi:hypothetical protein
MSWANVWTQDVAFSNEHVEIVSTSWRISAACNSLSPFTSSDSAPLQLNETEFICYPKGNHSFLFARSDVPINVSCLNKLKLPALGNSKGYTVEPLSNFEIDSKDRWWWKLGRRTDNVCVRAGWELILVVGPEPARRSNGHKELYDGRENVLPPQLLSSSFRGLHPTSIL